MTFELGSPSLIFSSTQHLDQLPPSQLSRDPTFILNYKCLHQPSVTESQFWVLCFLCNNFELEKVGETKALISSQLQLCLESCQVSSLKILLLLLEQQCHFKLSIGSVAFRSVSFLRSRLVLPLTSFCHETINFFSKVSDVSVSGILR